MFYIVLSVNISLILIYEQFPYRWIYAGLGFTQ